jgi:hypothetical protein
LNGKSITRTDSTDNSTALFVNAADAIVTITGDGAVTADHAVYVNAGKVVIENGTFSAGSHAVYVINNGNAEIKGGTFSSEAGQYHYALNEYDQTRDATSMLLRAVHSLASILLRTQLKVKRPTSVLMATRLLQVKKREHGWFRKRYLSLSLASR